MNKQIFITGLIALIAFIIGCISMKYDIEKRQPQIDLPEEYKEITYQDELKGFFDQDSVLHIEFNNKINYFNDEPDYTLELHKDGTVTLKGYDTYPHVNIEDLKEIIEKDNL